MTVYTRGEIPVWSFFDLTGSPFDDTFYMFVLNNEIPYNYLTVYQDAEGTTPWSNPIQCLANGAFPNNIYWGDDVTYRLEFRQNDGVLPPSQSDALIYLIENYSPGGSGGVSPTSVNIATDNQVSNPQFALINFESPYAQTSASAQNIDVAPGWVLELTGSGNVTLEQSPLNNDAATINSSNAPYALRINISGWGGAVLRQRFNQNGMLWANKTVSSSITARIEGSSNDIIATLVDSNATTLATVLPTTTVDSTFTQFTGSGDLTATTNPDVPPAAYIDYKLTLPTSVDIYVTSIQLIASGVSGYEPLFEQTSIDRQIDQTWHSYRDSALRQPKDSILTGWDFGLNPWQFHVATTTNLATFGYVADQTIVVQQEYVANTNGNNISTERAGVAQNYGFLVASVTATNQFALVQYIDAATVRPYWGETLSAYVKLDAQLQGSGTVPVKMRLLSRASVAPTLAQAEPIVTWAANGSPVYAAGWTEIEPTNDPSYTVANSDNTLLFEGFTLPASSNAAMTLAIVVYTTASMDSSGTPDNIVFNRVSLVNNDFAIDCNSLTFDETLSRCQYYYETSFPPGEVATATRESSLGFPMNSYFNSGAANVTCTAQGFGHQYKTNKRTPPTLTFYSGSSIIPDRATAMLASSSAGMVLSQITFSTFFTALVGGAGKYGFTYTATGGAMAGATSSSTSGSSGLFLQYVADARLGLVA